jgi:fatty acid-binding protein DegV
MKNNKMKTSPVSWLVDKLFSDNEIFGVPEKLLNKALQMESKNQQKYDEMVAMLEICKERTTSIIMYDELEQLIKEAKEL